VEKLTPRGNGIDHKADCSPFLFSADWDWIERAENNLREPAFWTLDSSYWPAVWPSALTACKLHSGSSLLAAQIDLNESGGNTAFSIYHCHFHLLLAHL